MKTYKIIVKDIYEIKANSPKEAVEKYHDTDKCEILESFTISKPKLIKS